MKKQKVITLGNEQLNKQDADTIHELKEGLNKIDQLSIYTPDLQWFEQMVIEEQQKARKKLIKDLALFFIVASIILSGMITSLYRMPIVFIFLQISALIFIVLYTAVRSIKKANHI